MPIG